MIRISTDENFLNTCAQGIRELKARALGGHADAMISLGHAFIHAEMNAHTCRNAGTHVHMRTRLRTYEGMHTCTQALF